ncbi:zinc-binding dehydrogenase [Paenibacillus xerothermodurans]|uniref:L-iditol 2-dehydrogenase n=1 Tax=Paenibacillus xerothermodurans TaxID=1977292 RepID=A0A2W1NV78_PAEXE|nr:alcohol dehydrogenase catalytic domain-containing protein [Paenibacillus xerothermodurans]PZE21666.1 L-iditol 2-dehydrogenase [Paenibacillus xerothermodurans]
MKIAQLTEQRSFIIEDLPTPTPGPRQILIRVNMCGICTGELHVWDEAQLSHVYPLSLGHEVAGVVEAVGSAVTEFAAGDRVAAINQRAGFAEHCVVDADHAAVLPDNLETGAALGEPIACAVNAARRIRPGFQDTIVIVGCGCMGLLLIQCLKAQGPKKVIAVDLREEAAAQALKYGADAALLVGHDHLQTKILELNGGQEPDILVEATGFQAGLTLCGELVKVRGKLVIYGYHQGPPRLVNMQLWNWKGLDVINAHERDPLVYAAGMKIGLDLLASGKLRTDELITHRFSLDQINDAFRLSCQKPAGYIKSVIIM